MKTFKKYQNVILIVLTFIVMAVSFSFRCYSSTIRADEFFSMGFANNYEDFLFLSPGVVERYSEEGWLSGEFLHDWISVQKGEEFAIMPIHRNVRHDVHPPLYFMLLNAFCSFFADEISLFPGYFINVSATLISCIFIYLIGRKIFQNRILAVVPILFWAASTACTDALEYLRMYAPLIALCMICLYLHLLVLNQEKIPKYLYFSLFAITTIGTLTHYYYYLWMAGLFVMTIVILSYRKQIKELFFYGMSLLGGEIISVMAYPFVFKHLLFSERGVQVQENLGRADLSYYFDFLKQFMSTLNEEVYSGLFIPVLIIFLLCAISAFVLRLYRNKSIKQKDETEDFFQSRNGKLNLAVISINFCTYLLILLKVSYSAKWIYLSPVYPAIIIVTVIIFAYVLKKIWPRYYGNILLGTGMLIFFLEGIITIPSEIEEHNQIQTKHNTIVNYQDNCDVIFLYDQWNNLFDNYILELEGFNQIYSVKAEDAENSDYQEIMSKRKEAENNLMVFIPTTVENYENKVENLSKEIGAKSISLVLIDSHAFYYLEL